MYVINKDMPKFVFLPFEGEKKYYGYNANTKNDLSIKIRGYYNGGDDFFYLTSAFWVYSEKDQEISPDVSLSIYDDDFEINVQDGMFKLYEGWNLMVVPPQFGSKYDWGNCKIEKIYLWDELVQNWLKWSDDLDPNFEKFLEESREGDNIGEGIAIKVSNSCSLGKTASVITPPSIPQIPQ